MAVTAALVRRPPVVASAAEVVDVVAELHARGLAASLEHRDPGDPAASTALLAALGTAGLARGVDLSARVDALAPEEVAALCAAARQVGATVTLDPGEAADPGRALELLGALRRDHPDLGVVLRARLRRTEDDCRQLAYEGSRVRLRKGARRPGGDGVHADRHQVDLAYVRCLRVLLDGAGHPVVATRDDRLLAIARSLAGRADRAPGTYELQLRHGVGQAEQERLADAGERVRVHVPWGSASRWTPAT